MNSSEAHSYLSSFNNFESQLHQLRPEDFSLDRIQQLLALAGDLAKNLKIVHIAGTKGKGSTCAFIARILQEAGYKVGLYSSPHLYRVNERIRILDTDNLHALDYFVGSISEDELASVLSILRPWINVILSESKFLTYFEVLTVAALYYFAKERVDIVILETGLGGRLDATNAVDSLIAVITPVSLDHTKILGSTLSKIAAEKAGIIKNSQQHVVIAPQEKDAMDVILERCQQFGIKPVLALPETAKNLNIALRGQHQKINAATAIEVVGILNTVGFKVTDCAVSEGLKNVVWPGRFQLLRKDPDLIADCAHNEASSKALAQTLEDEYPQRRFILVLGISEDKDARAICNALKDRAAHIILTKATHPRARAFTASEGNNYFGDKPFEIIENLAQALSKALEIAQAEDIIVVTGSVFVVAEAMALIKER